ncbi:Ap3s1 protein [Syncephalis plumigaleata]|nr:Ap3s1 protein [Syncephalis plumigaleata]
MIKSILIFNNQGKPRLTKFYQQVVLAQQHILQEIHQLLVQRPETDCNFLEGTRLVGGEDTRVIYRHYATLYFVFVVDRAESELGILDLIHTFVECLDRCFENVCELDLIFHFDQVHNILAEMVCGGMVLETNVNEITSAAKQTNKPNNRRASTLHTPVVGLGRR